MKGKKVLMLFLMGFFLNLEVLWVRELLWTKLMGFKNWGFKTKAKNVKCMGCPQRLNGGGIFLNHSGQSRLLADSSSVT